LTIVINYFSYAVVKKTFRYKSKFFLSRWRFIHTTAAHTDAQSCCGFRVYTTVYPTFGFGKEKHSLPFCRYFSLLLLFLSHPYYLYFYSLSLSLPLPLPLSISLSLSLSLILDLSVFLTLSRRHAHLLTCETGTNMMLLSFSDLTWLWLLP
jgi:hypothetical protein